MDYLLELLFQLVIYSSVLCALDVLVGRIGLLTAFQGACFGSGAYAAAIVSIAGLNDLVITLALAMTAGAILGVLLAMMGIRVGDETLVLASLAFQIVWSEAISNFAITGGPMGLRGIPPGEIVGLSIASAHGAIVVGLAYLLLTAAIIATVSMSPMGRLWRAYRESPSTLVANGKNPDPIKIQAFALSASLAAGAGCLYAKHAGYISPETFGLSESIKMVTALILGGLDSPIGPLAGALLLVGLPEALRYVGLSGPSGAGLIHVLYGVLLIALLVHRPQGLWGRYGLR